MNGHSTQYTQRPTNGYNHQPEYQPRNRMSVPIPIQEQDEALYSGSSSTPVPTCPVSKARRSTSANGCPVAHANGNAHANGHANGHVNGHANGHHANGHSQPPPTSRRPPNPRPSASPSPYSTPSISGNEDMTCPYELPDVSADRNPLYEEYDNELLYTDLRERVRYLLRFTNFTEHDVEALNDFQPILLPMVPELVDNVYHQLFKFDVTKGFFMPRKDGQEGMMLSGLRDLALDAPQIEMRKRTFAVYLKKLVTCDYDDFATWQYFDHIGIMHTGQNELKHRKLMGKAPLYVDLMHIALLLAWTLDVLTPIILSYTEYPLSRRIDIMRAFQKVTWIQNDLVTRHYAVRSTEVAGLNQIRRQHDLSSVEDVASFTGSSNFLPTSTVHSSSSGSSSGSRNANRSTRSAPNPNVFDTPPAVYQNIAKKPADKKHGHHRGWFGFGS